MTIKNQIRLMKEARKIVKYKKAKFICFAIMISTLDEEVEDDKNCLFEYIGKLLGESHSYTSWVHKNHPEIFKEMKSDDFRKGRLQWIDWMIEQLEKKL